MAFLAKNCSSGIQVDSGHDARTPPAEHLVGANGAGKSNLVLFFKMLNEMMEWRLQQFIATSGRAQSLLHFGPKVTPQLEAILEFATDTGVDYTYEMQLSHAAGDTLVFAEETLRSRQSGDLRPMELALAEPGRLETRFVSTRRKQGEPIARVFR